MRALKIGLTGGIGAGKSLACRELSALGAEVVDADAIARAQSKPGGAAYRAIGRAFGTHDRAAIAEKVFADPKARRKLEKLTHPLVVREMHRRLKAAKRVVIGAAPLLFEAKLEKMFDLTVTIEAPESVRRRRVAKRDSLAEAQIRARMKAQLSENARARRADVVWRNDGDKKRFIKQVRSYYRAFELLRHGAEAAQ